MESLEKAPLAVIMVNWRSAEDTIECLESLMHSQQPMRLIVCDNQSGDGSVEKILAWARGERPVEPKSDTLAHLTRPPVPKPVEHVVLNRQQAEEGDVPSSRLIIINTGDNLGYAGGNNVGMRMALRDPDIKYIWLLNNDTVVEPDAPAAVVRAFERDSACGMLGTVVRYYFRPDRLQLLNGSRYSSWTGRGYPIAAGQPVEAAFDAGEVISKTDFVCGASLAISRPCVEAIGLMDERYFLYFEEIDWAMQARGRFSTGFAADAVVYHKEGGSIGSSRELARRSAFSEYYLARSKMLFGRKHSPAKLPFLIASNLLMALRRITQGHADKAVAIARGSFNQPFQRD